MIGLLGAMGVVLGCGAAPHGAVAPVEDEPTAVVAPVAPEEVSTRDLLGTPAQEVPVPGMGLRGEGPQNGGPSYGPALGDIPAGGLGYGSGTAVGYGDAVIIVGRPTVTGPLPPDEVYAFFKDALPVLRVCYTRAVSTYPGLQGALDLRLSIGADGAVVESVVARSTLADDGAVRACLLTRLRFPTFSTAAAASVVVQPLTFAPG